MGVKMTQNAYIVFGEKGAREAAAHQAITVVIDALRASATTATALAIGAQAVITVGSLEEARALAQRHGYLVAGERNAVKPDDFDFGNSPSELYRQRARVVGRTLVLTTTNGTRIVQAARTGATMLFMGTTLNAGAVARATFKAAEQTQRPIYLVAAGEDEEHAEEDYVGARAIARHLYQLGVAVPEENLSQEHATSIFLRTPSATHLFNLGYGEDVYFCASLDVFDVAPVLQEDRFVPFRHHSLQKSA
ncbi:MAG: hypothetical protein D6802_07685 [Ardenticatenia bacterium]|nr:MAG: hypothetical protein D6802_07685 [Ardenticatenia bacterium]